MTFPAFISRYLASARPLLRVVSSSRATASLSVASCLLSSKDACRSFSTNGTSIKIPDMFCRQCEQTKDHYACTTIGICGKSAEAAASQDALMEVIKAVSLWSNAARKAGVGVAIVQEASKWTVESAFSTLTNVNFSDERIIEIVHQADPLLKALRSIVPSSYVPTLPTANITFDDKKSVSDWEAFGLSVSVPKRQTQMKNDDAFALNELATYGLKGVCAYAAHCVQLGIVDEDVMKSIHEVFSILADPTPDLDGLLRTALRVGEVNAKVLALLDEGHAECFGVPEISQARTTAVQGKCILVSGHDMMDLYHLLKQTEGTGVNVYTHGEMLPAHSYPKLKAFSHLVGNYGTAWQNQKFEFASFPGPVVVTTNCVLEPRRIYRDRLYTINQVGVDGVKHIHSRDFSEVINHAHRSEGFPITVDPPAYHTVGFNHRVVVPLVDHVIKAAQSGALSRILLIGGCDGSQWDRSYFTELAEESPSDTLILTMGCAKNRIINSKKLQGTLKNGMPRLLDMGQCNDSYSAVVVALELAKALKCSVNDLPLSLAVSHLEQKAAAVLLTLLHLGVKNIRLGPSLPAYLTPNVLGILQKNYNLMGTGDVQTDLKAMMQGR